MSISCTHAASDSTSSGLTQRRLTVGALFVDMVRYQWATNNHSARPDIDEVLNHPAWGPLLPDTPRGKRQRLLFGELDDGEV